MQAIETPVSNAPTEAHDGRCLPGKEVERPVVNTSREIGPITFRAPAAERE
jgi:hypothetical protein